jgi:hypothetical protein
MKKLLSLALGLILAFAGFADNYTSAALTGGTASTLLSSGGYAIAQLTFTASTTNATTIKVYDSSSSTNVVRAAYTNFTTYATNFNSVFTNESGVLITNTFDGTYTGPVANAAVTNERPVLAQFIVVGNGQRTLSFNTPVARGLVAVASANGTLEVQYQESQ